MRKSIVWFVRLRNTRLRMKNARKKLICATVQRASLLRLIPCWQIAVTRLMQSRRKKHRSCATIYRNLWMKMTWML